MLPQKLAPLLGRLASPRTQVSTLALLGLLQKSPALLRVAEQAKHSVEPATRILQKLTLAAASLGSCHALSGATTAVYSTSPEPPFQFETGDSVTIAFGVSNTDAPARSWSVTGNLPPGLTVTGTQGQPLSSSGVFNAQFGQITGSPSQAGVYTFFLQPWKERNGAGNTAEALEVSFTITATPAPEPIAPVASIHIEPASFLVSWSIKNGQSYRLQSSSNPLNPDSWSDFPAAIQTEGNSQSATLAKDSLPSPLFLRVATSQQ